MLLPREKTNERKWDATLRRTFNISLKQLKALAEEQEGLCWICGNTDPRGENLAIDHCHDTGVVRGLLCSDCNRALGQFKDSIENLERAIMYLKKGPAKLIELDEWVTIEHEERARWRTIVTDPNGKTFRSLQEAAEEYCVHSTTIRDWAGFNKGRPHLAKEGWSGEKVFTT